MHADRSLLSVALVTTFAAGTATGWVMHGDPAQARFRPTLAQDVYAGRLAALREKGYDEDEMRDAVRIHQQYLDAYQRWWREFLIAHDKNLDAVDRAFQADVDALEMKFRERTGAPPPSSGTKDARK